MDRASMALLTAEDNAAAIAKLQSEQKRARGATVLNATTSGDKSAFGVVSLSVPTAVIAAFDGEPCSLLADGSAVGLSPSPIFAVVSGNVTLALSGVRSNARLLILGAAE